MAASEMLVPGRARHKCVGTDGRAHAHDMPRNKRAPAALPKRPSSLRLRDIERRSRRRKCEAAQDDRQAHAF